MSSQNTRLFSQEIEMSQLDDPLFSQKITNNETSQSQSEKNGFGHNSNDYTVPNPERDEPLSTRAESICEQNRQIRGFVEKNLKQIEKKRIKLANKKSEVEKQIKMYLEKQKCQSKISVDLQMKIEELNGEYCNELNQRKPLTEKLKNTQIFVDYFQEHYEEILKYTADLEKSKQDFNAQFEKLSTNLRAKREEKDKLKRLYQSQMQEKTLQAQKIKGLLMKEREVSSSTIQNLVQQNVENQNKLSWSEKEILVLNQKKVELDNAYDDLTQNNKSMKESVAKLHQELDKLRAAHALNVQNLKLQINIEKNNNSNLQLKCEEKKHSVNILSTKRNELINLFSQMNEAIKENTKRQEDKKKELKELSNKKEAAFNEIQTLEEQIKSYERAPNINAALKSEILKLEESITAKQQILRGIESSAEKISKEEKELNQSHAEIEENVKQLSKKLEISISSKEELDSKLKEYKINNKYDMESKVLQSNTLKELNVDLAAKVESLTHDLQEAQVSNRKLKIETCKINDLNELYIKRREEADNKLQVNESDWENMCKVFNEKIDLKNKRIDEINDLISEVRPCENELAELTTRKETLKQEIQQHKDKCIKELENHKCCLKSKIENISEDAKRYTSVMEGIIKAEEEATNKLQAEIKETEVEVEANETNLRTLFQEIAILKKEEQIKRSRVVKLEAKLRTINKEVNVTRQDISDAIMGTTQKSATQNMSTIPSFNKFQDIQEPPQKKMAANPVNVPNIKHFNQIKTEQWVHSSNLGPDEYEFSDI